MASNSSYPATTSLILSVPYTSFTNMVPVFDDDSVKSIIKGTEEKFVLAGVTGAFEKLQLVPKLVELAYAGCKSSSSQTSVLQLQSGCLTLSYDTQITCLDFVDGCFDSLKKHKLALLMLSKNRPENAFLCLQKTSEMAGKMANRADELVTKSQNMCELAETALAATSTDNVEVEKKHKENQTKSAELEATRLELASMTTKLTTQVLEAKENEKKAADEADLARTRAFAVAMVSAVLAPLTACAQAYAGKSGLPTAPMMSRSPLDAASATIVEKKAKLAKARCAMEAETDEDKKQLLCEEIAGYTAEIECLEQARSETQHVGTTQESQAFRATESAAQREAAYHQERILLQEQERKASADLAGTVARLKHASDENNHLATAKLSLELAIKAIGRVTSAFEAMRAYWLEVKSHCDKLSDVSDMELVQDFEEEFVQAITDSWYNWLVLGRITFTSAKTMKKVIDENCRVMEDIPTSQEARERLPMLIKRAQLGVQIENDKIQEITQP
ncbi:hypothetical protein PRIC2_006070 [Phytophthora ramorum]|uniref:Uncharacterized protein n=1 Tax=Phytophthora ramorum TaxID=164328 RepID=H3H243_PHYRM